MGAVITAPFFMSINKGIFIKISGMKLFWYLIAFFGIAIGLYPVLFMLVDMTQQGLLSRKGELLSNRIYMLAFYMHIYGGGLALLIGWPQFKKKLRDRRRSLHKIIGKIYLLAILFIGAPAGLYIAHYADGGLTGQMGFTLLAIFWFIFSLMAYLKIREGDVQEHKIWMIRSYALTFAAVTLRIWLPVFGAFYEYEEAYPMISWLCWVPNMIFAELIIRKNWVV